MVQHQSAAKDCAGYQRTDLGCKCRTAGHGSHLQMHGKLIPWCLMDVTISCKVMELEAKRNRKICKENHVELASRELCLCTAGDMLGMRGDEEEKVMATASRAFCRALDQEDEYDATDALASQSLRAHPAPDRPPLETEVSTHFCPSERLAHLASYRAALCWAALTMIEAADVGPQGKPQQANCFDRVMHRAPSSSELTCF